MPAQEHRLMSYRAGLEFVPAIEVAKRLSLIKPRPLMPVGDEAG